jgi:hypothetical protein
MDFESAFGEKPPSSTDTPCPAVIVAGLSATAIAATARTTLTATAPAKNEPLRTVPTLFRRPLRSLRGDLLSTESTWIASRDRGRVNSPAMPDRTMPIESPAGRGEIEPRPELQQELDRLNEEVLRLRDLLIAKDAELGAALGRQAQLEQYSRHLLGVLYLVQRVPGAAGLLRAVLRRLQGWRGSTG